MRPRSNTERGQQLQIAIDPSLAEAVVDHRLLMARGPKRDQLHQEFHRHAGMLYQDTRGRAREAAFRELYAQYFVRLGCRDLLCDSLDEFPALREHLHTLVVAQARHPREQGSDLTTHDATDGPGRRAIVRLYHERFSNTDELTAFLRFSWLQLSDLIDGHFAYDGTGLPYDVPPMEARIFLQLYGVIWAFYTEVRLLHRGWALPLANGDHTEALQQLAGVAALDIAERIKHSVAADQAFTHADLLGFVRDARTASHNSDTQTRGVCALCGFSSSGLLPVLQLDPTVRAALEREYPHIDRPICGHCAERLPLLHSTPPAEAHPGGEPCPT